MVINLPETEKFFVFTKRGVCAKEEEGDAPKYKSAMTFV